MGDRARGTAVVAEAVVAAGWVVTMEEMEEMEAATAAAAMEVAAMGPE